MHDYFPIDPVKYGLSARIKIYNNAENHLIVEKLIKSRLVLKDAQKILKIAEQIKLHIPGATVSLRCYNNICSKSVKLLKDNNIDTYIVT